MVFKKMIKIIILICVTILCNVAYASDINDIFEDKIGDTINLNKTDFIRINEKRNLALYKFKGIDKFNDFKYMFIRYTPENKKINQLLTINKIDGDCLKELEVFMSKMSEKYGFFETVKQGEYKMDLDNVSLKIYCGDTVTKNSIHVSLTDKNVKSLN